MRPRLRWLWAIRLCRAVVAQGAGFSGSALERGLALGDEFVPPALAGVPLSDLIHQLFDS